MELLLETNTGVNMAMKFRTLRRHLREGIKNIFRNGWMSFASIAAVTMTLILVGAFLAIILNLNQIAQKIESDVVVKVLIDMTADEEEIRELGVAIQGMTEVDEISFMSSDDELENLKESMGEGRAWELFEQDNPLYHSYVVQTIIPQDAEKVAKQIETFDNVHQVNYGQDVVEPLFQFNDYARNIGLVIIVGLVLTAIFLISNTIKLTIMARGTEIGIMKLVGAKNSFIRWPFFIEGMFLGIFGSIIPITFIMTGYYFLYTRVSGQTKFAFIELLPFHPFAWQLSLIVLAIGTFIGMWGSVMSIRKFLKV